MTPIWEEAHLSGQLACQDNTSVSVHQDPQFEEHRIPLTSTPSAQEIWAHLLEKLEIWTKVTCDFVPYLQKEKSRRKIYFTEVQACGQAVTSLNSSTRQLTLDLCLQLLAQSMERYAWNSAQIRISFYTNSL